MFEISKKDLRFYDTFQIRKVPLLNKTMKIKKNYCKSCKISFHLNFKAIEMQ